MSLDEKTMNFWATDIGAIQAKFLKGGRVTGLPVRAGEARVPASELLPRRFVDVDKVVSKPSRISVLGKKLKFALLGRL